MSYTRLIPFKFSPLRMFNVKGKEEDKRTKTWKLKIEVNRFPLGYCGQCVADFEKMNGWKTKAGVVVNYSFEPQDNSIVQQPLYLTLQNLEHDFEDTSKLGERVTSYCYNCSVRHIGSILGAGNPSIDWEEVNKTHTGFGVYCSKSGHPNTCLKEKGWLAQEVLRELNNCRGIENSNLKKFKKTAEKF